MTDAMGEAWKQTIFYPYMLTSNYGRGTVLKPIIDSPSYDSTNFKNVPFVESLAIHNEEESEVVLFAVNRSQEEEMDFTVSLQGFETDKLIEFQEMSGYGIKQVNTKDDGGVAPKQSTKSKIEKDSINATLAPLSWNMIRVKVK
jgi:alpha-N-arabinofuranosidase